MNKVIWRCALILDKKEEGFVPLLIRKSSAQVDHIAAGSCSFSDAGETIWLLDQIAYHTQFYVRDSLIIYVEVQTAPIAPAIEGQLVILSSTP